MVSASNHGQDCDIAAIPVDAQSIRYAKDLLDEGGHDPRMVVDLGGELFFAWLSAGPIVKRMYGYLEESQLGFFTRETLGNQGSPGENWPVNAG
ncbi:hypothetical protein [Synechococcus sp. GFB01]|uniref:hypothetical protein n=1 Tax=Synechococcus sp. GFB01 TaxID=1662190 RepID=UPI000A5F8BF9|nr:hypothetical protein [Synechococcus sp. GFB01]